MPEWEVHGRAVAEYSIVIEADTKEQAWEEAKELGCPHLSNIDEVSDGVPEKINPV